MNERINQQALAVPGALTKLNGLGIEVLGIRISTHDHHAEFHLHGEFDPAVFNAPITTDYERAGKYIEHNCLFEGVVVFWLEDKAEVAA